MYLAALARTRVTVPRRCCLVAMATLLAITQRNELTVELRCRVRNELQGYGGDMWLGDFYHSIPDKRIVTSIDSSLCLSRRQIFRFAATHYQLFATLWKSLGVMMRASTSHLVQIVAVEQNKNPCH